MCLLSELQDKLGLISMLYNNVPLPATIQKFWYVTLIFTTRAQIVLQPWLEDKRIDLVAITMDHIAFSIEVYSMKYNDT